MNFRLLSLFQLLASEKENWLVSETELQAQLSELQRQISELQKQNSEEAMNNEGKFKVYVVKHLITNQIIQSI